MKGRTPTESVDGRHFYLDDPEFVRSIADSLDDINEQYQNRLAE